MSVARGRSIGFEADVAFFDGGVADAVDEFAVDGELDGAIDANDGVLIPEAFAEAAIFGGLAAGASRVIRHGQSPDAEDLAVDKGVGLIVLKSPIQFEDLHLDAVKQSRALGRCGIAPQEDAGIAGRFHVFPFEL